MNWTLYLDDDPVVDLMMNWKMNMIMMMNRIEPGLRIEPTMKMNFADE